MKTSGISSLAAAIISLYSWRYAAVLVQAYAHHKYDIGAYVRWYSQTSRFVWPSRRLALQQIDEILLAVTWLFQVCSILFAVFIMAAGIENVVVGGQYFGAALLLATPLLLAGMLPFLYVIARIIAAVIVPKTMGKVVLCTILEIQARRLREAHKFDVVAVVGSMGKTSTKLAIAHMLESGGRRVRYQKGNYNDRLTVPLVLFNQPLPGLFNIFAWAKILVQNEWSIKKRYHYDVVVLELGTDGPGQIKQFAYLRPEIAVVTGIAPEHMEFFKTIDAVAAEELAVAAYSHQVFMNADDVADTYSKNIPHIRYGTTDTCDYKVKPTKADLTGQTVAVYKQQKQLVSERIALLGAPGCKIALAGVAVADALGVDFISLEVGLRTLQPTAGRMQSLQGIHDSIVLDDTYNAAPDAACAALDVLQTAKVPQRIAVLGTMNELGKASEAAHREVAAAVDPKKTDLLITIGQLAHDYIAVPARKRGVTVRSFMNPYAAGEYVQQQLQPGAAVLFKGSQNGVFAEEAIKPLLQNPKDARKLVRQSSYWMKLKKKQFKTTQ